MNMDYQIGSYSPKRIYGIKDIDAAIKKVIKEAEEQGLEWRIIGIW